MLIMSQLFEFFSSWRRKAERKEKGSSSLRKEKTENTDFPFEEEVHVIEKLAQHEEILMRNTKKTENTKTTCLGKVAAMRVVMLKLRKGNKEWDGRSNKKGDEGRN